MLESIKISIVCNNTKTKIGRCLNKIIKFLKGKVNYEVIKNFPFDRKSRQIIAHSDLVVILGGDGTTLAVVRSVTCFRKTKLIPVDFGTLGYMNSVGEREVIDLIKSYFKFLPSSIQSDWALNDSVTSKGFKIDSRCMLLVTYKNRKHLCLNELVLTHSDPSKPIMIQVTINDEELASFKGNGVILATPTGSTAYNMSAGGPIIAPNVDALILNPLSAHLLNFKPIVLSGNERIKIYSPDQGAIVLDGIKIAKMVEPVFCEMAEDKLLFLKSNRESHIKVLKNKLNFAT